MKVFVVAAVFAILGSTFANKLICPHPEEADKEVASERISLDAPEAGHSALELDLSNKVLGREVACFTLATESQNTGPHIVSLGKNVRGGFSVKIYTEERQALHAFLQAYTPLTPGPTRNPYPDAESASDPNPSQYSEPSYQVFESREFF